VSPGISRLGVEALSFTGFLPEMVAIFCLSDGKWVEKQVVTIHLFTVKNSGPKEDVKPF